MISNIKQRNILRKKSGLKPIPIRDGFPGLKKILSQNWSYEYIQLMKNRMMLGFFRYGPMDKKDGGYDNIGSIEKRLYLFKETGNDEILVDISNLAMCEYVNGTHPKKHFKSIDDGVHTERRTK